MILVHFPRTSKWILILGVDPAQDLPLLQEKFGTKLKRRVSDHALCVEKTFQNVEIIKELEIRELQIRTKLAEDNRQRMQVVYEANERKEKVAKEDCERNRQYAIHKNDELYAIISELKDKLHFRKSHQYNGYCSILMNHQKVGASVAALFDKYAFFYDTGTGKTVMAHVYISYKI